MFFDLVDIVCCTGRAFSDEEIPKTTEMSTGTGTSSSNDSGGACDLDRDFMPRSLKELIDEHVGKTSMASAQLSGQHKGYWKKIECQVIDVSDLSHTISVFAFTVDEEARVHMYFVPDVWRKKLNPIAINDRLSVVGQIDSIDDRSVTLKNCELLEVQTPSLSDDVLAKE